MRSPSLLLFLAAASMAPAALVERKVEYRHNETVLEGILVIDDTWTGPRPGVMVVHDWDGPNDYERMRARMLAGLGYAAFVADVYGKGVRPTNPQENGAQAGKYRADRALFRGRLNAALETMKAQSSIDRTKIAAIGYCFGGGGVLELARSGAELLGVVSFHGNLDTPQPADASSIQAKVQVHHAIDDPVVPRPQMLAFFDEMKAAKKDYVFHVYNVDTHAFTAPGGSYRADADRRSWESMKAFFTEIFG